MSFKHKNLSNWDTEELKEWIQESQLFDEQKEQDILTCIKVKSYNGYHFYDCDNVEDIKNLFNEIYDDWCIDDEIATQLYQQVQYAQQTYPVTTETKGSHDSNKEDHKQMDADGDTILNNESTVDTESFESKCLISWTSDDLKEFIQTLTTFTTNSIQILISQVNIYKIDGSQVYKCNNDTELQYLFQLCSPSNRGFFGVLFDEFEKVKQTTKNRNSYWNKHVFNWNAQDVKNWILTLTPNMCKYADLITTWQVNGLFLILHVLDPNGSAIQFLTCLEQSDSALLLQHAQDLGIKYNISDEEVKNKQMNSEFGLIGLTNQGNTCFMNTAIQLILQSPGIYQYFRDNSSNVSYASENSKWYNPKRYMSNKKSNKNGCLMIDYLLESHSKSRNDECNCIEPVSIFKRICEMDKKYRFKKQQDCAVVMSLILQDVDRNLNNKQVMNESDEKDEYNEIPFSSSIVVKQELSKEQEEMIIHERLLKKHNPYNTIIRQSFDGVQKIVSTCMDCNWKRIEYETFRAIKLPLINNKMSINIEIYIPNQKSPIKHIFKVEGYTKMYVLKHQIAQLVLENACNTSNISMDNIVIGSISPSDNVDRNDWITFYNSNEKCAILSSTVNLFATFKYNSDSKLITIFDVKIDANETIKYDGIKFIEIKQNLPYTGSDLLNLIADYNYTQNKNNICVLFEDGIIDIKNNTKYTFDTKTNVLVLIEMQNNELKSKCFPSLNESKTDCVVQWIIEDCINKFNSKYNKKYNYVKHIPLSAMINDLEERLNNSDCNNDFYIEPLQNVLNIIQTQHMNITNIIKYLQKCLSVHMSNKNVIKQPILDDIYDCISEYEREKILDYECSQMYCKKCKKKPKVFSEKISIVYSPSNLTFRIERGNDKEQYKDKFNHLVKYPYENALILSNGNEYNLYGVGIHSSWNTLRCGHYIAYIKSIYNHQWYEISDSSLGRIAKSNINKIQNQQAIILMYTKSI